MITLVTLLSILAPQENTQPWLTDTKMTRETAIKRIKCCVIILNVDAGAL